MVVRFLFMQDEWVRQVEALPRPGDRVTFGSVNYDPAEVEFEVSVVHWFQEEWPQNVYTPKLMMVPHISLRRPTT